MNNLFCLLSLFTILIFKKTFCTNFYDSNITQDDIKNIILDLEDASMESTNNDFEIIDYNDLSFPFNIIENLEVADKEKPNKHLLKILEEFKNASSLINKPLDRSIFLNFIDRTINLINHFKQSYNNKMDDNVKIFGDSFRRVSLHFLNLEKMLKEVELLYEEKKASPIYFDDLYFRGDFFYIKGIMYGLTKEFERCLGSYENICKFDNTKKIKLLCDHIENIRDMRGSIVRRTENDVQKQVGFLKNRFFKTIILFYEGLCEIFETENRFFECHFRVLDLVQKDIDECVLKLEYLKKTFA